MNKSNTFVLISCLIILFGIIILTPLSGKVYTNKAGDKPYDPLSAFMQNTFSSSEIKNLISLNDIDHIVIHCTDAENNQHINITQADSADHANALTFKSIENIRTKIENRTLTINIDKEAKQWNIINIGLNNHTLKSLSMKGLNSSILLTQNSPKLPIEKFLVNNSTLKFFPEHRRANANQRKCDSLEITMENKSIVELRNLNIGSLQSVVNNSRIDVDPSSKIDTATINLLGLSHMRHVHLQRNNNIGVLNISGQTDYYNSHAEFN